MAEDRCLGVSGGVGERIEAGARRTANSPRGWNTIWLPLVDVSLRSSTRLRSWTRNCRGIRNRARVECKTQARRKIPCFRGFVFMPPAGFGNFFGWPDIDLVICDRMLP